MSIDLKVVDELNRKRLERQRESWIHWKEPLSTIIFKRGPVLVKLHTRPRYSLEIYVGDTVFIIGVKQGLLIERKAFYAAIREVLGRLHRPTRKEGALVGRKCLILEGGKLISPTKMTRWEGLSLTADARPDNIRRHGIYAIWPLRDKSKMLCQELNSYYRFSETVVVELLGHGTTVIGEKGWRAEHVTICKMWADFILLEAAKEHFGLCIPVEKLNIPLELII